MNFYEYVKDIFVEHHNCMGMSVEESNDLFNENNFNKICKWLTKIGYDLDEYHLGF